ncbi:hypothetical protein [Bacteriovorax sp. Seq25_V]|uniref:hypothetical protein n=1 Tax=Bacteriovorax sp. Seq25_V TaxID=1201288 RepID=UPI0012F9794F|nr:hypothetical protein [Bacteriovorax sp. Seq25_V]
MKEVQSKLKHYRDDIFIVERAIDYGVKRLQNFPGKSYLEGHLQSNPTAVEYFDDEKVYQFGDLQKKYPTGTKIPVLFNPQAKAFENGQSIRVIARVDHSEKIERVSLMTYSPLGVGTLLLLLSLISGRRRD